MERKNEIATKLMLKCKDELWNKVLRYKLENNLKNVNSTVIELIERGLSK